MESTEDNGLDIEDVPAAKSTRGQLIVATIIATLTIAVIVLSLLTFAVPGIWIMGAMLLFGLFPLTALTCFLGLAVEGPTRTAGFTGLIALAITLAFSLLFLPQHAAFACSKTAFSDYVDAHSASPRDARNSIIVNDFIGLYPVQEVHYVRGGFIVLLEPGALLGHTGFAYFDPDPPSFTLYDYVWKKIGDGWYEYSPGSDLGW